MSTLSSNRKAVLRPVSLAAAMLMAAPAYAYDGDAAGDEADQAGQIVVTGKQASTDLPTARGPIIDVPQVVSVVSAETLKEQKIVSLEQALRNVAGVTTQVGEGGVVNGDQFFIRGQAAGNDVFTDGLRDFGQFSRDAFNYEQIEVLKGSSSTALGRGVAGGAINTSSKMPGAQQRFAFDLSGGTDEYRRITVDGNMPLSDNIAVRINGMAHQNDVAERDVVGSKRRAVAPAISFGLNGNTQFTAIYLHQEEDRIPDYGVPIAVTSSTTDIERPITEWGVPRSNFYGFAPTDADDVNVDTLTLKFRHEASEDLIITSDTKLGSYHRFFRQSIASCAAATCGDALTDGNPLTIPVMAVGQRGGINVDTKGIQNVSTLLYKKPLGNIRNELLVGWDFSYQTSERITLNNGASVTKNIFTPVNNLASVTPGTLSSDRDLEGTDIAFFIDDRVWLADTLSINLGLRYQNFVSNQEQFTAAATACNGVTQVSGPCLEKRRSENNLWSPKAAVIWEPSAAVSTYLSYSRASVPPGNAIGNGDSLSSITTGGTISRADLPPEKTETFDAGVKLALFGNRMLVQSAIYQINRDNATTSDPVTGFLEYSAEPKQRLRGFELGLSGGVTPELRVSANYAYIDAEIREAFTGTTGTGAVVPDLAAIGKQVRYVPKHAASLWANYQAGEGALKGLGLGAGVTYQSKVYLNAQNTQVAPSYVSYDALLAYTFGQFRLAVNGFNLSNRLYYSQVNGGRVVPAAGRSFVASLGISF